MILLAVPAVLWAQGEDIVSTSSPLDVEKGTFRLTLEDDFTGIAYTKLGVHDDYEGTMYFLYNLGVGLEYAYARNRTIEVNVHPAILFSAMDWERYNLAVMNVTSSVMHRWYHGRWTLGAGLSFEYRKAKYLVDRYENEPIEYQDLYYGDNEFEEKHYNIGADLMAGWGKRKWWIGIRYSPRLIVKDVFRYKEDLFPQLPVTNRAGNVDHQVGFVIRMAFKVGKIKK
jgi:hypothetical protein